MARAIVDIRSLARVHTETCIRVLARIAAQGESEPARIAACNSLLDRGWGKADQHNVDADGAIQVVIRHIIEGRDAPRVIDAKPVPLNKPEQGDT